MHVQFSEPTAIQPETTRSPEEGGGKSTLIISTTVRDTARHLLHLLGDAPHIIIIAEEN